jgi:hypothetical protein
MMWPLPCSLSSCSRNCHSVTDGSIAGRALTPSQEYLKGRQLRLRGYGQRMWQGTARGFLSCHLVPRPYHYSLNTLKQTSKLPSPALDVPCNGIWRLWVYYASEANVNLDSGRGQGKTVVGIVTQVPKMSIS